MASSSVRTEPHKRAIEPVKETKKYKKPKQTKDQRILELKDALEESNRKVTALDKSIDVLKEWCGETIEGFRQDIKADLKARCICADCYLFDVDCDATPSDDDEDEDIE